jgi:hypothetical protein
LELKKGIEAKIILLGARNEKAIQFLNFLFSSPIISSHDIIKLLWVTAATANSFIKIFIEMWVLIELTWYKRHKIFAFENYLRLFR